MDGERNPKSLEPGHQMKEQGKDNGNQDASLPQPRPFVLKIFQPIQEGFETFANGHEQKKNRKEKKHDDNQKRQETFLGQAPQHYNKFCPLLDIKLSVEFHESIETQKVHLTAMNDETKGTEDGADAGDGSCQPTDEFGCFLEKIHFGTACRRLFVENDINPGR